MASAKEVCQIIEATPIEQAIMVEGIHGCGKSEIITSYFRSKGYRVIALFLGQMADAGDVLGLPHKVTTNGVTKTVYAHPEWWPTDKDEKVLLFLDELNRARPEIHQVIMDLVLNRKLAGTPLPENVRVVSAVNPIGEGMYQVEELDPALLDRFNKYDFRPTLDEWMDYCLASKVSPKIMGFISKNNTQLDPPTGKEFKQGQIYPSRRSWKRLSDIINNNPDMNEKVLQNVAMGIIGASACSAFMRYWRENKQIHVGTLLTNYQKVKDQIKEMQIQDLVVINREICNWLSENEDTFEPSGGKFTDIATKICYNIESYSEDVPGEVMAEFIEQLCRHRENKKTWPEKVLKCNPNIKRKILNVQSGSARK